MKQVETLTEELEIADEIIDELLEDSIVEEIYSEELNEEKKKKKWIQGAIKKEGALHKSLKVKSDKKIPEKKLEAAAEKGGKLGKRARLALTLKKLSKKKKEDKEKKELKEAADMVAQHSEMTDYLKSNGNNMKKDDVNKMLQHIAGLEGMLGKKSNPNMGYAPWLTVEGTY